MKTILQTFLKRYCLFLIVLLAPTLANAQCFTQLYPNETNLIGDPEMTDAANFAGWGTRGITNNADTAFIYCGNTSGYAGNTISAGSGSLDYLLTGVLQTNTAYRIRAFTYVPEGVAQIGMFNAQANPVEVETTKNGEWEEIDFVTVTGNTLNADAHGVFFNSWQESAPIGYIDNWEVYAVPAYESGIYDITLNTGYINETVDSETLTYTATLPYGTTSVTPTVTSIDPGAAITGNDPVTLSATGGGTSTIVVTGRDGTSRTTYTINYAWATEAALSDLTVDQGILTPSFDPGKYTYTVYAPMGVTSVTLTATPADPTFSVTGDEAPFDISSGSAVATIEVRGTGVATNTYTVNIIGVQLRHAYTFEDGTANDTQGAANGTLQGAANILNGHLILDEEGDFVDLDAATIAINTYDAVTTEMWVVTGADVGCSMASYFGETDAATTFGINYLYTSVSNCGDASRTALSVGASEPWAQEIGVNGPNLGINKYHHVVSVVRGDSIIFYVDGVKLGQNALDATRQLANVSNSLAYIGQSGYTGDVTWQGKVLEYNIYHGAMDANAVAQRWLLFDNDNDNIINAEDNCVDVANTNQADDDADGVGNLCDPDYTPANLSNLTIDHGTLIPAFDPNQYTYTVYAPMGVNTVNLTATPEADTYTVTGAGTLDISSGSAVASILVTGTGRDDKIYTVNVIGVTRKHGYTFETDASDVVGTVHGTIEGGGTVVDGSFVSSSTTDGISFNGTELALSTYDAITLEAFVVSSDVNTSYHMLAYFGNTRGDGAYWIQPARGNNMSRNEFAGVGVDGPEINDTLYHHFVSTLTNDEMAFYIDGQLIGKIDPSSNIADIKANFAYLALSGWPDPAWQGEIFEFNIYNGVMDPASVAERFRIFDNDGDLIADRDDKDDDNDGQLDAHEISCGSDPLNASSMSADADNNSIPDCMEADGDGDGVANFEDNCPDTANSDQADMDGDGTGDVCDNDRDGDGINNTEDSCPDNVNTGDTDGDGIDETCDPLSASSSLSGDLTFGDVAVSTNMTKTFTIINSGTDQLNVTNITAPSDFAVDQTAFTVDGGSFTSVTVTFTPTLVQAYTGEIAVESNAGVSTMALTANGTEAPVLSVDPNEIGIKFGPNPVTNSLFVDWIRTDIKNPTINIYDVSGKILWHSAEISGGNTSIDLTSIREGVLFMHITSGDKTHVIKLLKE